MLAGKDDVVVPVCGVGAQEQAAFLAWLEQFPAVDRSGVFPFEGPTNTIYLYDRADGTRVACSAEIAAPIPYERVKKFLGVDGILVNMASGSDITLETLDMIRMDVRPHGTPIHFDFHNLTMGVSKTSERFRRPLPEWRRWAFLVTTVQLNEKEAAGLGVENMTEEQTVGHLLTLGMRGVVITRGFRGATLFVSEHKKIVRHDVAGGPAAADGTGLGDIFGAAFLRSYLGSSDLNAAAEAASRVASTAAARPREARWTDPAGPHPGDTPDPTQPERTSP